MHGFFSYNVKVAKLEIELAAAVAVPVTFTV